MKFFTSLLALLTISSVHATQVFTETYRCQNGETISLALDVVKNLPAATEAKKYCSVDERGETCDTAYSLKNSMTATWTLKSTIAGLGSLKKSFPIDILIFPISGANPVTLVNDLGFNIPQIRRNEDRYFSFSVGANFSYKMDAVMNSKNVVTDLTNLDEITLNGGLIEYSTFGEPTVLCNF